MSNHPSSLDPKTTTGSSCATEHGATQEDKQRGEASGNEGDKSGRANEEEISQLAAKSEEKKSLADANLMFTSPHMLVRKRTMKTSVLSIPPGEVVHSPLLLPSSLGPMDKGAL
jgi:hypothetical protein